MADGWLKGKALVGGQCPGKELDLAEVRRALALFADPSAEVELRSIGPNRSAVRAGTDLDGLVSQAACLSAARALYFALNPVRLGAPCERAAKDEDVLRYRWLFTDIDSVRPDARENCATEAEKAAAAGVRDALRARLTAAGWPAPVEVDSGNGYYLIYRIDLDTSDASRALLRTLLHRLADEYPEAKIDRAVHNPSRIVRLPGSWNRKGKDCPARPHRMARLLSVPDDLQVVSRGLLEAAAGRTAEAPQADTHAPGRNGKPFSGKASDGRLAAYARSALEKELLNVAFAVRGSRGGHGANNTLNEAAFSLGTMDAWGVLDEGEARSLLAEAARRVGLDESEIPPTIESGYSAGKLHPRPLPEWARQAAPPEAKAEPGQEPAAEPQWSFLLDGEVIAEGSPSEVLDGLGEPAEDEHGRSVRTYELCTIGNILETTYPEPRWIVPGILSEGLNILAGAPKMGKSMLSLNLALTIAGGGLALGKIRVEPAGVLYLSLEDQFRRVRDRAVKMLRTIRPDLAGEVGKRLTVATDWPKQDEGGLRLIELWASRAEAPGLVIIDVWNRFAPKHKANGNAYAQDADHMGAVKRFCDAHGLSALVVHHTRKPGLKDPEDFLAEVSGTTGLSGAADGVVVLARSRQEQQASLHVTGRDVQESELVLEFDRENLAWKSLGAKADHVEGRVQKKVFEFLRKNQPSSFFIKEIAESVEEKAESVRKALYRLGNEKQIAKKGQAFVYPGEACGGRDEGEV